MPKFCLNTPSRRSHPFYELDDFARGYVEAMFFSNCDSGDEDENKANRLGVERLTRASVAAIKRDCAQFLAIVNVTPDGEQFTVGDFISAAWVDHGYTDEQAGRDLWFARQGHGAGFWDRKELDVATSEALTAAAKMMGSVDVEIYGGWIHHP